MDKVSDFFSKLSMSSGAATWITAILAYREILSVLFAGIGAFVAVSSLFMTMYYRHKQEKRAQVLFDLEVLERRKNIESDTQERRRKSDIDNHEQ